MTDPLGLIGAAGRAGMPQTRANPAGPQGGPSFKEVLLDNINEVNRLQQDANKAIEDLSSGKRADLEGVILATQKADTAFRALQAVRNKVIEAYEEVKQIRV